MPQISAMVLDTVARINEFRPASIQTGLLNSAAYQRKENPGGGNSSDCAEENDIAATISTGRHRKTSTSVP